MSKRFRTLLVFFSCARLIVFFSDVPVVVAAGQEYKPQFIGALSTTDLLADTNAARETDGEPALRMDPLLVQAAEDKAEDMRDKGYWAHFRPGDHKAPWDFITTAGYTYKIAGENLAQGFRTSRGITGAWLNSPAHRANLLSAKYTDVGFASLYAPQPDGTELLLTVQMFGSR